MSHPSSSLSTTSSNLCPADVDKPPSLSLLLLKTRTLPTLFVRVFEAGFATAACKSCEKSSENDGGVGAGRYGYVS